MKLTERPWVSRTNLKGQTVVWQAAFCSPPQRCINSPPPGGQPRLRWVWFISTGRWMRPIRLQFCELLSRYGRMVEHGRPQASQLQNDCNHSVPKGHVIFNALLICTRNFIYRCTYMKNDKCWFLKHAILRYAHTGSPIYLSLQRRQCGSCDDVYQPVAYRGGGVWGVQTPPHEIPKLGQIPRSVENKSVTT
jgi:hypothetical protein